MGGSRFDIPSTVATDQGRQFESGLWHQLMKLLETKPICTMACHTIANALVERFHRQLKAALRAQLDVTNWEDHLPMVLLGIRTALKEDLHCTAAELDMVLPYTCQQNSLTAAAVMILIQ